MKLRTRLFLWVGIVFLLAFVVSLALEVYLTRKSLDEAQEQLRNEVLQVTEKRREQLEEFLHVAMTQELAKIDSLLFRFGENPKRGKALFIQPEDLPNASAANSAALFAQDRWIDLLQATKNGALSSLLIPLEFPMKRAAILPIEEEIYWVFAEGQRPWIGIGMEKNQQVLERDHLLLFESESLKNLTLDSSENPLAERVIKASKLLKEKNPTPPKAPSVHADPEVLCLKEEGELFNVGIVERLQRDDQARAIKTLGASFATNLFGSTPFSKEAPRGVLLMDAKGEEGNLVLTKEVFFREKVFDDGRYMQTHQGTEECMGMGTSLAVITTPDKPTVFLGNSLVLGDKQGYLTVAIDMASIMQELVLSLHKLAFVVHDKEVVSGFNPDGSVLQETMPFSIDWLKEKNGTILWKGEKYVFQHITPYPNLDLHFFILEPAKEAFALVNQISEGSKAVLHRVSWNMRLVSLAALFLVLALLHNIAKKITRPIVTLARSMHEVASGKFEEIQLPQSAFGRTQEVASLCDSFCKMVEGLQEKEKVQGVLNKVVSPQIAKEILKGQVHLGGEERKVTVLFADIRQFTHISSNLEPGIVIEMLNNCMTKISHEIDAFGGVIDKYVGDEVMALFGAPIANEEGAFSAIECAIKMIEVLKEWNVEREKEGHPPIEMGVGIHTGAVLAGNMGAENRLNYTVIGSNVNLASRLCSAAAPSEILISDATYQEPKVKESFDVEKLPPQELKGFDQSFVLYRIKGKKDV